MAESTYKIIELVGTSPDSWEAAARGAVERASSTLRDLRIAEVENLDMTVDKNKVVLFRARIKLSFKYEEA
ncbi:MAG: dodecin family protein [Dehalococcoidia bacterium]|jgi:flavin-binding protein dodecin